MIIKKVKKVKASKVMGAPKKPDDMKVDDATKLYVWQKKRYIEEARIRNIPVAAMIRLTADWFITALDTGRADSKVFEMFDNKEVISVDNK